MIRPIKYIKTGKYKYELVEDYQTQLKYFHPILGVHHPYITITRSGLMTIQKGYMWDGPSGPTFDTPDFIRGSLIHDCLYQLMRLKHLDYKTDRIKADKELYRICREDGMSWWRAGYVYNAVRWFAEDCAKPSDKPEQKVFTAPPIYID